MLQDIGAYNQQQGDMMGAVGGYAAAGASLFGAGSLGLKGLNRRNLARNATLGMSFAGQALEGTRRMSTRAASTGRNISRGIPRSSGRSLVGLPMPSPTSSGSLVNPAAATAITSSPIRSTRAQRIGHSMFKSIGSALSGGFFS